MTLIDERAQFIRLQSKLGDTARQRAALQLVCGLDLDTILATSNGREFAIRKVRRLMERERLRGGARHWSYDLNRHIALRQALTRLEAEGREPAR